MGTVSVQSQAVGSSIGPSQDSSPLVLRQRVEEVLLYATAVDHQGHPVMTVPRSGFTVHEDGKPVPIIHFASDDLPVSLSLVLDDSSSMQTKRSVVQTVAATVIRYSKAD